MSTAETNAHRTHTLKPSPNISSMFAHNDTYNYALTSERFHDRHVPGLGDATSFKDIGDRRVEPMNYFGVRHGRFNNPRTLFNPAGIDGRNSKPISGIGFTKPVRRTFPENL